MSISSLFKRTRLQHKGLLLDSRVALSSYAKPFFQNEPSPSYQKGSPDRANIMKAYRELLSSLPVNVSLDHSSKGHGTESVCQINPSNHKQAVAEYIPSTGADVQNAIESALQAKSSWERTPFEDRAGIFLRAAGLVAGKYRHALMASTMVGQGKNIWQAEIDVAAETCDLLRFNVQCAMDMFRQQPAVNPSGMWNRLEYRPLEGFVYAISPFNFTALGATLACGPLLMGNVVVWKPSPSAFHSSWLLHKIMIEAGLPENVLQFVAGDAEDITSAVLEHRAFAGLNFTGSSAVFKQLTARIGQATGEDKFLNFPRIVGETGGKNFHLVHKSAGIENAVNCTIRSAFEFQGQKCSAGSRLYVPESIWPAFKENLLAKMETIKVGSPEDVTNFVNPVIHEKSFDKLVAVIEKAKTDSKLTLLCGGKASKETGYFVHPTIYQTSDPHHEIMQKELFGPLLAVYVYPDSEWANIPRVIDATAPYALTGSIFACDAAAIRFAEDELRNSAGNFYINTKSTGSVVGQQPFGGMRGSGTNDKVGSVNVLSRFTSVRAIKEDFEGTPDFKYPSNEA
ncbi:1-pyrroline-5-carboxylate dehydrogenase [Neopestalotiopsis sp. 37M]|nr:1-pyrroline-5-carboxylate dehydrogenase [Neopestalotiopsis sp. 37M]